MTVNRLHARQKHLSDNLTVFRKDFFIGVHQNALTDSRRSLFARNRLWLSRQAQPIHTNRHSARGNQDHLFALILPIGQFAGKLINTRKITLAVGMRNRTAADFHNNAFGVF